jgi:hypothetical protein
MKEAPATPDAPNGAEHYSGENRQLLVQREVRIGRLRNENGG